jgi:hypothetical protein
MPILDVVLVSPPLDLLVTLLALMAVVPLDCLVALLPFVMLCVRMLGVVLASMPLLGSTPLHHLWALQLVLMTNTLIAVLVMLWVWILGVVLLALMPLIGSTPPD